MAYIIHTIVDNDGITWLIVSAELQTSSCTSVNLNIVSAPKIP